MTLRNLFDWLPWHWHTHKYKCYHCGKVFRRRSTEHWVESYCRAAGRTVFLLRMEPRPGDKP